MTPDTLTPFVDLLLLLAKATIEWAERLAEPDKEAPARGIGDGLHESTLEAYDKSLAAAVERGSWREARRERPRTVAELLRHDPPTIIAAIASGIWDADLEDVQHAEAAGGKRPGVLREIEARLARVLGPKRDEPSRWVHDRVLKLILGVEAVAAVETDEIGWRARGTGAWKGSGIVQRDDWRQAVETVIGWGMLRGVEVLMVARCDEDHPMPACDDVECWHGPPPEYFEARVADLEARLQGTSPEVAGAEPDPSTDEIVKTCVPVMPAKSEAVIARGAEWSKAQAGTPGALVLRVGGDIAAKVWAEDGEARGWTVATWGFDSIRQPGDLRDAVAEVCTRAEVMGIEPPVAAWIHLGPSWYELRAPKEAVASIEFGELGAFAGRLGSWGEGVVPCEDLPAAVAQIRAWAVEHGGGVEVPALPEDEPEAPDHSDPPVDWHQKYGGDADGTAP